MLAGQGLRDVTRIAGSDPALWEQIVGANSDAVLESCEVQDQLGLLIKAVEATPATNDLRNQLEQGVARDTQDRRQAWGGGGPLQRGRHRNSRRARRAGTTVRRRECCRGERGGHLD